MELEVEPTYGNWRRPESPGLFGLGTVGTAGLLGGLIAVVLGMIIGGILAGFVGLVVLTVVLTPLLVKDRHERNGFQRIGVRVSALVARGRTGRSYVSGPLGRGGRGRFRLPGLAARMTAEEGVDGYNRPFVVLVHPGPGEVSTVIRSSPVGASLVDTATVSGWVAQWGAWLAELGAEPGLTGASTTIDTSPDPGVRLAAEVNGHVRPEAPDLARKVMNEVVADYPGTSADIRCYTSLTWSQESPLWARRRTVEELTSQIAHRLPVLTGTLGATGAGASGPLSRAELAATIRAAYDPSAAQAIEMVGPDKAGVDWEDAGPVATDEGDGYYWHDGWLSATWVMSGSPRGQVYASVLRGLLRPHAEIARKRVTILYRPHSVAEAAAIVERDKRDAAFVAGASRRVSARHQISAEAANRAAREEAHGAGLVRFATVVTATIPAGDDNADALRALDALITGLGSGARIVLRRQWCTQAVGFLASLPLGLVLPSHAAVPRRLREGV